MKRGVTKGTEAWRPGISQGRCIGMESSPKTDLEVQIPLWGRLPSLKRPMPKQSVSLEGLTSRALPLITSEPKPRSLSQSIHPCPELLGSFLYFILHPQDLLTWSSTTAQKTLLQPKTTQTWGTISTSRVRSPAMPETAFRNSMHLSRLGQLNPAQSPSAYIPVCAEPCRL